MNEEPRDVVRYSISAAALEAVTGGVYEVELGGEGEGDTPRYPG